MRNYLAPYLADARTELTGLTPEQIVDRFLGWCSRPLRPIPSPGIETAVEAVGGTGAVGVGAVGEAEGGRDADAG
ncbi:hypothetical protein ABT336_01555 [Micromonospora sp. NPDC000207]|uniref:hypothetical protein n=1 Tax=Micromonospora sp. NPDC000207 TaxID=3154246 RepID=UPI0033251DE8